MSADQTLYPDMSGLAIYFDFCNFRDDCLTAECVCDSPAGENVSSAAWPWRRTRIPAKGFCRCFDHSDRPCAFKPGVVVCRSRQEFQAERYRIRIGGSGKFV